MSDPDGHERCVCPAAPMTFEAVYPQRAHLAQSFQLRRSGGVAESWIYGDVPLLEQPFWDIAPIPVLLAPGTQLC